MKTTIKILIVLLPLFLLYSCKKKEDKGTPPVLTTSEVTKITISTAVSGGTVTDDPTSILSKGICYSTEQNPTIQDKISVDNSINSTFLVAITGLTSNSTYYVRAFATNSIGTGYGNQVKFTTLPDYSGQTGTVSDVDGNTYPTIGIGSQVWMAKNLVTTKFQDGTPIPLVTSNLEWATATPAFCYYNNSLLNKTIYGGLYNYYAIDATYNGNKNVCPSGWHVPSDMEFITLITYLGEATAAQKLKESGTSHWLEQNSGTNTSAFTALPGGVRYYSNGAFDEIGYDGLFWSSTSYGSDDADKMEISGNGASAWVGSNKGFGFSVRCLKN